MTLLEVRDLSLGVVGREELLLRDVSLTLEAGEVMGVVGESGSGKTMACLAILGLLPPSVEIRGGTVTLDGRLVLDGSNRQVSRQPGDLTMVFQNPRGALNPTMRVGKQIRRVLVRARGMSRAEAGKESVALLRRVGIPGADRVARAYPHQLSGGMCQRVVIAMALGYRPRVLIADEPTTGLDVTVQAQIFDLIRELVAETGCGVLFITHDLGAVAEMCDRVSVLYAGQLMETGTTIEIFERPEHPYTRFLLESLTPLAGRQEPLAEDAGVDFSLPGCRFAHRCPHVFEHCTTYPPLFTAEGDHQYSCFLGQEDDVVPAQRSRPA
ncbi:MAG: ABC transporter ATP-binding protein [Nocardioidaceae bacterium]